MLIARLINKEDVWNWGYENNLWNPEPNLEMFGSFDNNMLIASGIYCESVKSLVSLKGKRKIIKSDNGSILLEIKVREFEKNTYYMKIYNDPKNRIDIKDISGYDGYLFFDIVKENE